MSGLIFTGTEQEQKEARIRYNQMCREQEKLKLLSWISRDMVICELENMDKMEYIYQLKEIIDHFIEKHQEVQNDKTS